MNRAHYLLLLFLFAALAKIAGGQTFPMLHFSKKDGIPSNIVYNVYRDSKGYIWLATDQGVARYNGINFEIFTTLNGLADNDVFFFREDMYGRLWLAGNNGELCYYADGEFHSAANTPFLKLPFKSPLISHIIINADSSVTFNYEDFTIALTIFRDHYSYHSFVSLPPELRNWGICKKKVSQNCYELTLQTADAMVDTNCRIRSVTNRDYRIIRSKFAQNQFYLFNGEHIYDDNQKLIRNLPPGFYDKNTIYTIYRDRTNFFIGTSNGLFINDSIHTLSANRVSGITQDNTGNYWISTLDNGVYCLKNDFADTRILEKCYPGDVKYCYQDTDHLLFATSGNSVYQYRAGSTLCLFNYEKTQHGKNDHDGVHLVEKTGATYHYYALYGDDRIFINDLVSQHRKCLLRKNIFKEDGVKSMLSSGNRIYVHSRRMVISMDDSAGFLNDSAGHSYRTNSPSSYRIFGMAEGPGNVIYYSTFDGLFKIEKEQQFYLPEYGKHVFTNFCFSGQYLLGITFDAKLILCYEQGGLVAFDTIAGQKCIWQKLYPLDSSHIIISTNNLYRLVTLLPPGKGPQYRVLTIETPFVPRDAEAISSDGNICYFFKNGAITSFTLRSLLTRPEPPSLLFTSLKSRKKRYMVRDEMKIPYSEAKNISISFSALAFNGRDISFEYSISSTPDDDWVTIKGDEINLVNLKYGTHYVKLRAKTISSKYSTPIQFRIYVTQPFWTAWWFIIICIIFLALALGAITRYRIRVAMSKKEKEHDAQIKYLKAEYTAMNALMNPHFIFNTLNNVQSMFHENDLEGANEYLRVFASLIRQNMQNISKELIPLQMEIALVSKYLYLEKMRFENRLNFSITIDEAVDTTSIHIPPLLIQPLVENAIKHGILPLNSDNGFISVHIYEQNEQLFIEVKDNGRGLQHPANRDNAHESLGLGNIKKRIHHLGIIQNKHINFRISETQDNAGAHEFTVVTISFPI